MIYSLGTMTPDFVFDDAVNTVLTNLLVGDLAGTGHYHDPVRCKPDEVLAYNGKDWLIVNWYNYAIGTRLRRTMLDQYYYVHYKDNNIIALLNDILNDATRIQRDMEKILVVIKEVSPIIINALDDLHRKDYVGSMIKEMCANPTAFFEKYGIEDNRK